jgi:hypothetical protein
LCCYQIQQEESDVVLTGETSVSLIFAKIHLGRFLTNTDFTFSLLGDDVFFTWVLLVFQHRISRSDGGEVETKEEGSAACAVTAGTDVLMI